jgi:hypothetical protein
MTKLFKCEHVINKVINVPYDIKLLNDCRIQNFSQIAEFQKLPGESDVLIITFRSFLENLDDS